MARESFSGKRLSEANYVRCLQLASEYVAETGSIRNREIREVAGIGYDEAIYFFNRAVAEGQFERRGKASGTHYVRSTSH
jgi:hypothetical protein